MASFIYKPAKAQWLQAGINMLTADIRLALVDSADYTPVNTHEFLSSVAAGIVARSTSLTGKSIGADGSFNSDFKSFSAVTGDPSELLVMFVHTGTDATARVIACYDTGTGLPVTPDGRDIKTTPASGKWFTM